MSYPDIKRAETAASRNNNAGTVDGKKKLIKIKLPFFSRSGKRPAQKIKSGHKSEGRRSLIKIMALQFAIAAAVFCVLLIFKNIKAPAFQQGYETVKKAFLYNIPVSENDDDIGKIKFVDKIKENAVAVDTLPLEIVMPVIGGTAETDSGVFSITGYRNCMVFAPERGAVKAIGFYGSVRYIDVQHPGGVVSRLQGITAAGVKVNESVKKGQPLGTAETGGTIVFCIFKDNRLITSAVLRDNRIEW